MDDNKELLKELRKMNELLEKIDWKLWNFHKKFIDEVEQTTEVEKTAEAKNDSKEKNAESVSMATKYPTIETWE